MATAARGTGASAYNFLQGSETCIHPRTTNKKFSTTLKNNTTSANKAAK